MPAKFVLKKGSTGKFRFNLHATNGQVIASSETYDSKQAAVNGIKSVQKNAAGAAVVDETEPAAAKKTAGRTAGKAVKKAPAKRSAAKKSTAKRSPAKKATARKSATKKTAAKKATAKRSPAKKAGTKAVRTVRRASAR